MIHQDYVMVAIYSMMIWVCMQFMFDYNYLYSFLGWMGFGISYTSFINYAHSRRNYERTH